MISLSRIHARAYVDREFERRVTDLVARTLESEDRPAFVSTLADLHNDFDEAAGIIDSNFPE